jgi:hypothetical protein
MIAIHLNRRVKYVNFSAEEDAQQEYSTRQLLTQVKKSPPPLKREESFRTVLHKNKA